MKNYSFVNASVTVLKEEKIQIIVISDFSNLYSFYFLLDLLEIGRISKLNIIDDQGKKKIIVSSSDNEHLEEDSQTLFFSTNTIQLTKKMISDVLLNQAFPGYHLDLSLKSSNDVSAEISLKFS